VEHVDVVIVGAGPVGAMLAIELRLHGIEVLVLERLVEPTGQSRASALHARTVATLRRRGPVGTFADDLRIETGDGPRQLADLLADGRAYLLNLTGAALPSALGIALLGCPDRVGLVTGRSVTGPAALLVRPDGYLAWVAAENPENPWSGAGEALRDWFGVDLESNFTVTQSDEPVTRVGG
jgi:choline dehydrogenase-like flavoprotein